MAALLSYFRINLLALKCHSLEIETAENSFFWNSESKFDEEIQQKPKQYLRSNFQLKPDDKNSYNVSKRKCAVLILNK